MGDKDPEFLKWVKKQSGVVNNWTGELEMVYDWFKNAKIKKSIFEHVSSNVTHLNCIGGEPTVLPEFYELLEYCHEKNTLGGKSIALCTNVTNMNPKVVNWLPKAGWVTVFPSVDGVNDRQEYIRYPSNWHTVVKNLYLYKELFQQTKNGAFTFQPSIQALNIDMLDEMIEFFLSFADDTFQSNVSFNSYVQYPLICNYHFLPTEYKTRIADKLSSFSGNITNQQVKLSFEDHIKNLTSDTMEIQERKNIAKAFVKYNDAQDKFRGRKTWRELLPDLEKSLTNLLS
jgi:MoaA/NifB/PqqE/SkfB family radical SAM enzyme